MNLESALLKRSQAKCELCSADAKLSLYTLLPSKPQTAENSIMICDECRSQIEGTKELNVNHWRCLNESMWSEFPAVQAMASRMLKRLSNEPWAMDLLDQLFLDEDVQEMANAGMPQESETSDTKPTKDSNGTILADGDSVTLIKDLEVKGANFTAKRGTLVKNISLTSNPEQIEGRVNGTQIVLLTCFLKKVV